MPGDRHEGPSNFSPAEFTPPKAKPPETTLAPNVAAPEPGASDEATSLLRVVEPVSEPTPIFQRPPIRKVTREQVLAETSEYWVSDKAYFGYLNGHGSTNRWAELKRIHNDVVNERPVNRRTTAFKVYWRLYNIHRSPSPPVLEDIETSAAAEVFSEESKEKPKGILDRLKSLLSRH